MKIEITDDQALVLFEWLSRLEDSLPVEDRAEELVLWLVHAQLEKTLSEPFRADYAKLVDEARARVKAAHGVEPA